MQKHIRTSGRGTHALTLSNQSSPSEKYGIVLKDKNRCAIVKLPEGNDYLEIVSTQEKHESSEPLVRVIRILRSNTRFVISLSSRST
jgi:hypothetical protein